MSKKSSLWEHREISLTEIPNDDRIPLYGTRGWLECVAPTSVLPVKIWGLFQDGKLVAWHPYQEQRKGPLIRWLPLHGDTTGGPYYLLSLNSSFDEAQRELRLLQTQMLESIGNQCHLAILYPWNSDPRLLPKGWSHTLRATVVNDLNSEERLGSQAKDKVRRAKNKNLQAEICTQPLRLSEAISLVHAKHQFGKAALPEALLLQRREKLQEKNLLETWRVIDNENHEIAYALVALDHSQHRALLWFPFSTPEGYKEYAADFLHYSLVQHYKGKFATLDLCGADHFPLTEFKEKWTQRTEWRFALHYYKHPLLQILF